MKLNPKFENISDVNPIAINPEVLTEHIKEIKNELDETPINLVEKLDKYEVKATEKIPPPAIVWEQITDGDNRIMGTLGNFTLIIGKAKSRKSFFINIIISVILHSEMILNLFTNRLPENQKKVLYFDTEQSKYHVQLAIKRIGKQISNSNPDNLKTYHLRSLNPLERLKMIEAKIYNTKNLGLVVIDGIRDLVTSINDEEQATEIGSYLLKWTEELNIHIIVVLHQNKGDNNARGHLGTELMNKAETVLSVTKNDKDKNISVVEAVSCRNKEPEPFPFEINEDGIPVIAENFEVRTKTRQKGFEITDLPAEDIYMVLKQAFSKTDKLGYGDLVYHIKTAYKQLYNQTIGNNKTKDLITEAKINEWLIQEAERKPYSLGKFNEVSF